MDLRKTHDLLSVQRAAAPWLPFDLHGTADAAIVDRACVSTGFVSKGLLVVFELQPVVADADGPRAVAKLMAADIHSNLSVVLVLTDLNQTWRFFRTDGARRAIKVTTVNLPTAIEWLQLLVRGAEAAHQPPPPLAKRRKIVQPAQLPEVDVEGLSEQDALTYKLAVAADLIARTPGLGHYA